LLLPDLESTFSTESAPKLLPAALWSTQLSRSAPTVTVLQAGVTVRVRTAGVSSVLPLASVARTRISCDPTPKPVYWRGDVQEVNVAWSSEHSNVEPDSLEGNPNVALVLVVSPVGPESIS
jgi:hypothetical protein